jgi:hypothetical protein
VGHNTKNSLRSPQIGLCSIATSVTSGGIAGQNTTSGGRDFSLRPTGTSQGLAYLIRHNAQDTNVRPINVLDTTSGYRIFSAVFNGTSSAVGDVAANTKSLTYSGWRFDGVNNSFAFNGNYIPIPSPTNIINISSGTTLQPTIMRLGGDTCTTQVGTNPHFYFEEGISEVMVFNTPLTLEQRQLVEGFLSQKYASQYILAGGSTTVSSTQMIHPYRLARVEISPSLSLTSLYSQGLTAWFDAANASTFGFASANNISSWTNIGGNFSIPLIANGTNYPTLVQNAQNGLSGVRFVVNAGTGTPLGSSFTFPIINFSSINTNNEFTIITVYKQPTFTSNQVISNIIGSANNPRLAAYTNTFSYRNATTEQSKNYTANVNNQTYITIYYRRGNTLLVRDNGIQDAGGTSSGTNLTIPNSLGNIFSVTLGAYAISSPTSNPFAGDIYEHIIFRYALTDQAIYQIEGYLAWKWGLQTSLPTTHPYYRVRP